MTRRQLLAKLEIPRIEAAIRAVERKSSIELRVSVAGLFWGDPQRVAERAFARLKMSATAARNGVLLLVAPWHRRVVIVADTGITSKVPAEVWNSAVQIATTAFAAGEFSEGLAKSIEALGEALSGAFPPVAGDRNELPDTVDR